MGEDKLLELLLMMEQARAPMSAADCAAAMGVSASSFKKNLNDIRAQIAEHGCEIMSKSGRGNGYELIVTDNAAFRNYVDVILPASIHEARDDFSIQSNRVQYIVRTFLQSEIYLRSEDLADRVLVSQSQFNKDLALVRRFFEKFHIKIVSKPHYGMKVQADELSIRACIASIYAEKFNADSLGSELLPGFEQEGIAIRKIREIILECAEMYGYELTDVTIHNLTLHIFVAIRRMKGNNGIQLDLKTLETVMAEKEYDLAFEIIHRIEEQFDVQFSRDEICYVVMHLAAKKIVSDEELISGELMELVDEMLARMKEQFKIDLSASLDFRIAFALHTVSLLKRIQFGLVFKNPLMDEIKDTMVFAYDLAACACSVINEHYDCVVSPDEIGYYAIHVKAALDNVRGKEKKNILIICSSGRGSANLLRADFLKKFGSQINMIETYNLYELDKIDFSRFDCAFSTVPVRKSLPIPLIRIHSFLDAASEREIDRALEKQRYSATLESRFEPDLFFGDIEAEDKEQAIREIIGRIGTVRELPPNMLESVLRRESLDDTKFSGIAIPHTDRIISDRTIVSVSVLRKPVRWGNDHAQVVILSTFAEDFTKHNSVFFDFLLYLAKNKNSINKLIAKPEYKTLMELIEEFYKQQ